MKPEPPKTVTSRCMIHESLREADDWPALLANAGCETPQIVGRNRGSSFERG